MPHSKDTISILHSDFLNDEDTTKQQHSGLALIILNWSLPPITKHLLQRASFIVCADGGANRLYDEVPAMFPDLPPHVTRSRFLPNLIKGDLDSVRPDIRSFYESLSVPIVDLSHDQVFTDLQKCVAYVDITFLSHGNHDLYKEYPFSLLLSPPGPTKANSIVYSKGEDVPTIDSIVAVGAHGGRLDHVVSNLSTLYSFRHMPLVLCGDGNLTRLVPAGKSIIRPCLKIEGPKCGLFPLGGPAVASSTGLHWNVDETEMKVGGLISTSNIIESDQIEVTSDADLIWTTEVR